MVSWKIFSNFVAHKITAGVDCVQMIFLSDLNSFRILELSIFDFQRVDSTNQGINHYPLNGSIGFERIMYWTVIYYIARQHYPTCKG